MSFFDHIRSCNNFDPSAFRPLEIEGTRVGWVRHEVADRLTEFPAVFRVTRDRLRLASGLDDFDARSAAVDKALRALAAAGHVPGWRDEMYPVTPDRRRPPLLRIERAACALLGIRAWGVHMNGFVRRDSGLHLWVARRAGGKQTYPSMLDNMVAGGQPLGLGLMENLIKECAEEAAIPEALAKGARAVGLISYDHQTVEGLKPDQMYCYDLELPEDFTPRPADGEVEEFMLWPIEDVSRRVRDGFDFKFNCNLVVIDFLIRHGVLDPDTEPDYAALCEGLRRGGAV